ncbi:hypothetical protein LIS66_12405 [Pseudomonas sp. HN2]|uniref:hypothetical protein n=1 Tax=Pseudomonas sp. HN2 TaxID=2884805 RepID=UPI001D15BEAC|nr:hypothetical protein [Pseudomonas sp. HN2]UEB98326.1 hypothetical protein LIS66_12405 [Pseudomonas sp. HN2]
MNHHEIEFCWRMHQPVAAQVSAEPLFAPTIDGLEGSVLDPSLTRVVVRIAPYANMTCGDQLVLYWEGLDIEGFAYQYERIRFISQAQVGKDVIFVIKGMHVAALDGGSLQVYWALQSPRVPGPVESARLQLSVGDVRPQLLAPHIEGSVNGALEPLRVAEGTLVTLQPYARMSVGDRVMLSWHGDTSPEIFTDALKVEAYAVGQSLSFWVPCSYIEAHRGGEVVVGYRVEQPCATIRTSEPATVFIGPAARAQLVAPDVVGAIDDVLSVKDSVDGVAILIEDAQVQEDELVYLKLDGEFFGHRDDLEITPEMAGQPLSFTVPHRFWREHHGTTVEIGYTVERLDDVSQQSAVRRINVVA